MCLGCVVLRAYERTYLGIVRRDGDLARARVESQVLTGNGCFEVKVCSLCACTEEFGNEGDPRGRGRNRSGVVRRLEKKRHPVVLQKQKAEGTLVGGAGKVDT